MARSRAPTLGRVKALLLENIHPLAVEVLTDRGFEVELLPGSLSEAELLEKLPGVSLLGIRSNTNVTERVLEEATEEDIEEVMDELNMKKGHRRLLVNAMAALRAAHQKGKGRAEA